MKFLKDWFHNKEIAGLKSHLESARSYARSETTRADLLATALQKAINDKVDTETARDLKREDAIKEMNAALDNFATQRLAFEAAEKDAANYKADSVMLLSRLTLTQEKLDHITTAYADMQVARLEENVARQQVEEKLAKVEARYKKLGAQFRALKKGKSKVSKKK